MKNKGLIINNEKEALCTLKNLNYYTFAGYLKEFIIDDDHYEENITFEHIYHIMEFDRKLRGMLYLTIEPIEHVLRTKISYFLAHKYGSLGYLDKKNFNNPKQHNMTLHSFSQNLKKNKHLGYVIHHNQKYDGNFPIWVAINLFSLGMISNLYSNLMPTDKEVISNDFNTSPEILENWIDNIAYIRNINAHYMRLYNQTLKKSPLICQRNHLYSINSYKIFDTFYVMKFLTVNKDEWNLHTNQLKSLFDTYDEYIDLKRIGFPDNWFDLFIKK